MEPLNTYFRISPSLYREQFVSTPRSTASSSFSSPSFADHQTGLKVYRDSPPSLNSSHQVVDDNPLFEGFPVLPNGSKRTTEDAADNTESRTAGISEELQEQLHHLVQILQRALELHNSDGLPDGLAPQLADELEAMAKKLKQKEREVAVERQLRTKVQAVLTGAAATIKKLRSTPTRGSAASHRGLVWRYSSAYEASPTCAAGVRSSHMASEAELPVGHGSRGRSGLRDSVCKQLLLQSPSNVSPLTCKRPGDVVPCSPLVAEERVSPKELPVDDQPAQATANQWTHNPHFQPSSADFRRGQEVAAQGMPSNRSAAAESDGQPALYSWMKAALASASKQTESTSAWESDAGTDCNTPTAATPAQHKTPQPPLETAADGDSAAAAGDGLAAAVRAALASARSPLVYGSPLHRRIQRLLASQRSPSPLRHASSQAGSVQWGLVGGSPGTEVTCTPASTLGAVCYRGGSGEVRSACSSRLGWGRAGLADSPGAVTCDTDTTSSCDTPIPVGAIEGDLTPSQFRSGVSPFGITLRQKYAGRTTNSACTATAEDSATGAEAAEGETTSDPQDGGDNDAGAASWPETARTAECTDKEVEAAALVEELGLDLPLDATEEEGISKLEVLEHVERWARGQYMAAKKALASVEPAVESRDGDSCECGVPEADGVDGSGARAHPLVDMATQTEIPAGESSARRDAAVGTTATPRLCSQTASPVPPSAPRDHRLKTSPCRHTKVDGATRDDILSDVCSPARSDQLKRSPARVRLMSLHAVLPADQSAEQGDRTNVTTAAAAAGVTRKHHAADAEFGSPPARRGLFSVASSTAGNPSSVSLTPETLIHDRVGGTSMETPRLTTTSPHPGAASAGAEQCPSASALGHEERLLEKADTREPVCTGRTDSAPARSCKATVPDVMLTPGSNASTASRHTSRVFPAAVSNEASSSNGVPQHPPRSEGLPSPVRLDVSTAATVGSPLLGRAMQEHVKDLDESAAEVLFTPGNALPGGNRGGAAAGPGKHRSRVFPADSTEAVRISTEGSEEVLSPRTLSSISTVSIIEPELEVVEGGGQEDRLSVAAEAPAGQPGKGKNKDGARSLARTSVPKALRGFFASLVGCAGKPSGGK